MKFSAKKLTVAALCVALGMVLSFLESLVPTFIPIPGVKLGLANVVTVFLVYSLGALPAILVSLIRVLLSALLFGNVQSLAFSLCGAALSLLVMLLVKHIPIIGVVGVSVLGGIAHNAGQIIAAIFIMGTEKIVYYFIPLVISGTVAGVLVGVISGLVIVKMKGILDRGGNKQVN